MVIVDRMLSRKAEPATAFHVPSFADDHPSWVKVSVIAAVGFAVGVAWPRLAGVKLGPSAPEMQAHAASAAAKSAEAPDAPPPLPTASVVVPPPLSAAPSSAEAPTVTVGRGVVLSCTTADGERAKGSACGSVTGFEALAQPRLESLAKCPAAAGVSGKLAVVVTVDFKGSRINVDAGKSTTVASPDGLYACLRTAFQGAPLGGVDHDQQRYTVFYAVTLASASAPVGGAASATSDGSSVEVAWGTALVRSAPKTGDIVARLPRGSQVQIGAPKEGWYPIKYGADFGSDGWVWREAIGK
jgi:hypothetical protein